MATLVALAGFMGSGKSSVGAAVARLLGWSFVDLDDEIANAAGMPVADIFAHFGEAEFRRREADMLGAIVEAASGGVVLALGGGALQDPQSARLLNERGGVVLLDVDAVTAWERAQGADRPLAKDKAAFSALYAARRPAYERAADWIIPVGDRGVDEIAAVIARAVRASGPSWQRTWGMELVSTSRPSTIVGGEGCLAAVRPLATEVAARGARLFLITDENVERAWGSAVAELVGQSGADDRLLVLPAGEPTKSAASLARCWSWLASQGARRDDVIVALGGGVIGDLAGFAAATYQRGVDLWQIPTSLLAQVDSSVGGKTAIDLEAGKNLVGAFYQPSLVIIDPETLRTLPADEFVNGLGEVVKYGLLSGDGFLTSLEQQTSALLRRDPVAMSETVKQCVRYKADVVAMDEHDTGRRAVLNLGHTTAHALEVSLGFGELGHGRAVALGLLVALAASENLLGLDPAVRGRTKALMEELGLTVKVALPSTTVLREAAARDKKVTAASSGFVGLRRIGEPVYGLDLPAVAFEEALEVIRA